MVGVSKATEFTDVAALLKEEKRRCDLFTGFDPLTGEGCPSERKLLKIPDMPFVKQRVPVKVYDNPLIKMIRQEGSIRNFIVRYYGEDQVSFYFDTVVQMVVVARAKDDPAFALFVFFRIQSKTTGEMVPFKCNFPQRIVLTEMEDMRRKNEPIRLVVLKARQWGGSTLVQLYMAWVQLFLKEGWYSVILAQTKDTSKRIKAMYTKVLANLPAYALDGEGKLHFSPYEKSASDSILTWDNGDIARNNVVSIASYENYDSVRGNAYAMAHYSEVAFWKDTDGKSPEEVISSVSGGIMELPLTIEVLESSARGNAGYFYDECQLAMKGESGRRFIFIPFYYIEHDTLPVKDKKAFAAWLLSIKDMDTSPEGCADAGKYYWRMWMLGATFEHIKWYIKKRKTFHDHANMATEAPIDPVEAFKNSGNMIFNPYRLDELAHEYCREPLYLGDVRGKATKDRGALDDVKFVEDERGCMKVWAMPNSSLNVKNRYLVSVDIGGRSRTSDYSVITVLDRMPMMAGMNGVPKVVARWRGHIRHDYLAWKAAQIACLYNNALLVFESNTYDAEKEKNTDGEHLEFVLDEVGDAYENMYYRRNSSEEISEGQARKWGFNTNKSTKIKLIDNLVVYVDDGLWNEPDKVMYEELRIYEKREDGSFGNIKGKGNHDDVLMSTAIALYISQYEMDVPKIIAKKNYTATTDEVTAATI